MLGLGSKEPINAARWNAYLAKKPEVRARVERQALWPKDKMGEQLASIYSTLSSRIHVHQVGDRVVTISDQTLHVEACLGVAALLDDFVFWEFDPPGLKAVYDEKAASARGARGGVSE